MHSLKAHCNPCHVPCLLTITIRDRSPPIIHSHCTAFGFTDFHSGDAGKDKKNKGVQAYHRLNRPLVTRRTSLRRAGKRFFCDVINYCASIAAGIYAKRHCGVALFFFFDVPHTQRRPQRV